MLLADKKEVKVSIHATVLRFPVLIVVLSNASRITVHTSVQNTMSDYQNLYVISSIIGFLKTNHLFRISEQHQTHERLCCTIGGCDHIYKSVEISKQVFFLNVVN